MGANAQTSVPAFTAGQVLTAQQQTEINTGIPVFATTVERDAAFGGTGEKTLAEGQLCYVENLTGVAQIQYYDGSTWTSLSSGGLTLLSNTAHSAAATVNVDNVFTSTYTKYRIVWQSTFSTTLTPTMRFRAGGTATTTNYAFQFASANSTTVSAGRNTSQANLDIFGGSNAGPIFAQFDLYGPNLAANTAGLGNVTIVYSGNIILLQYAIAQVSSTQFDGLEINASTGNMTGNLWIYGYKKDV